jgi:hypothetical protein
MLKLSNKKYLLALVLAILILALPQLLLANDALTKKMTEVATAAKLSGSPLTQIIGQIINAVLGILGVIFLILIFYAGFLWMTDAGSGEKIKKAKGMLLAAAIGLVLCLAAFSITNFVLTKLAPAVSSGQVTTL